MTYSAPHFQHSRRLHVKEMNTPARVDDTFLSGLVTELDDDAVTAIILRGSYARGDATSYSDIDLTRFVQEPPETTKAKQFTYREGFLISISTRTIVQERERLAVPERAIFVVPGLREAHILLDKHGAFRALQQEAEAFRWEPLQEAANVYASTLLMEHTEYVLKILRALLLKDEFALSEITLELLLALTDAVAVQRGMLVASGNTYFQQVQEVVGVDSAWTRHHRLIAGIDSFPLDVTPNEARGLAVLRLFQETVKLLQPVLSVASREVVEQTAVLIEQALSDEEAS